VPCNQFILSLILISFHLSCTSCSYFLSYWILISCSESNYMFSYLNVRDNQPDRLVKLAPAWAAVASEILGQEGSLSTKNSLLFCRGNIKRKEHSGCLGVWVWITAVRNLYCGKTLAFDFTFRSALVLLMFRVCRGLLIVALCWEILYGRFLHIKY